MDSGANSWANLLQSSSILRSSDEYARSVEDYLDHAFSTRAEGDQITCPCKECYHRFWYHRVEVYNHLIANDIDSEIKQWHFDHKGISAMSNKTTNSDNSQPNMHDDMESLLYDTHRDIVDKISADHQDPMIILKRSTMRKLRSSLSWSKMENRKFIQGSKLSFIIRLYLFKYVHGLTNAAFSELLDIIRELIPDVKFPKSYYEARKLVSDLGLHYQKIDACCNDCILFWKENESATTCRVCHAPGWKEVEKQPENNENDNSCQQ